MTDVATLEIEGKKEQFLLRAKTFTTGSKGFFASGKMELDEARRLQVTVNAVIIGSKPKGKTDD